jgi:hypothetical protein
VSQPEHDVQLVRFEPPGPDAIEAKLTTRDVQIEDLRTFTVAQIEGVLAFVLAQFEEKQKALDAALTAQKEAVTKAEIATDRIALRAQADQEALRGEMSERLAALRGVLELATAAQKEAVLKQEQATERRFEGVNEWRAQSADRERSQAEDRAKLNATFIPREVADAQFAALRHQLTLQQTAAADSTGERHGAHNTVEGFRQNAFAIASVLLVVIALLTGHLH